MRLTGVLYRFWFQRGNFAEPARRLERLLAYDARPTAERGAALLAAAVVGMDLGDTTAMRTRANEALEIHRSLGDDWGAAYATMMLSNAAFFESAWQNVSSFEACLAAFRLTFNYRHHRQSERHRRCTARATAREKAGYGGSARVRACLRQRTHDGAKPYFLARHEVDEGLGRAVGMIREALRTYARLGEIVDLDSLVASRALAAKGDAAGATRLASRGTA
jgi:hypothetical protein